jgi:hypothetical protein
MLSESFLSCTASCPRIARPRRYAARRRAPPSASCRCSSRSSMSRSMTAVARVPAISLGLRALLAGPRPREAGRSRGGSHGRSGPPTRQQPVHARHRRRRELVVAGNGGIDTITSSAGQADLIKTTITGGDGNDVLVGTDGNDSMFRRRGKRQHVRGAGNDSVSGARGNDDMAGDDGDDILIWNPARGPTSSRAAPATTSRRTTAARRPSTSSSRPTPARHRDPRQRRPVLPRHRHIGEAGPERQRRR